MVGPSVTFFYPGHALNYPKMFGTMDTISTYDKIESIYWAMKEAIETNFPIARFIAHFSHWYDWGCMMYDRFIIEQAPKTPWRPCAYIIRFGNWVYVQL